MFLIDTNVISELRNPRIADRSVLAWAERLHSGDWFLSAITILELERGALRALRKDERKGVMLIGWLKNRILPEFNGRILPVDLDVALRCAALHVPDPKPERDAMIAATGLVHGLTIVTRNVGDFASCGVPTLDPWAFQA
jgi:predicted nucleic acid-binding protein